MEGLLEISRFASLEKYITDEHRNQLPEWVFYGELDPDGRKFDYSVQNREGALARYWVRGSSGYCAWGNGDLVMDGWADWAIGGNDER